MHEIVVSLMLGYVLAFLCNCVVECDYYSGHKGF